MPATLVRPYVRAIPIAALPTAPRCRSDVAARAEQSEYQPRHRTLRQPPAQPRRRVRNQPQRHRIVRRRRPSPSPAWGVLLILLGFAAITAGSGAEVPGGRMVAAWVDERAGWA